MVEGLAPAGTPERPVRHQGILLLWAIGRAAQGLPRLVRWTDAQQELRPLLTALGREGSRPTPQYPFVALTGTQWWELPEVLDEIPRAHGSVPLLRVAPYDDLRGLMVWSRVSNRRGPIADRHLIDVHVLLVRDDDVLLTRRRDTNPLFDGLWHLPSGKLDAAESVLDLGRCASSTVRRGRLGPESAQSSQVRLRLDCGSHAQAR
jgi:hypothetical protein